MMMMIGKKRKNTTKNQVLVAHRQFFVELANGLQNRLTNQGRSLNVPKRMNTTQIQVLVAHPQFHVKLANSLLNQLTIQGRSLKVPKMMS